MGPVFVYLSDCLSDYRSVRHRPVLYQNGCTYIPSSVKSFKTVSITLRRVQAISHFIVANARKTCLKRGPLFADFQMELSDV